MVDPNWTEAFVAQQRVGRLATVDRSGGPYVVPICYIYDGQAIYSPLDEKPKQVPPDRLRRVRNILDNPHVCLLVDEYDEDWQQLRYVQIHGLAELVADRSEHQRVVALLREKYPQYRQMAIAAAPVIKIVPRRMKSWRF